MNDSARPVQPVLNGDVDWSTRPVDDSSTMPAHVRLPSWEPWGGAGCFGNAEMDSHMIELERFAEVAREHGQRIFALAATQDAEVYAVTAYDGDDLDPYTVPGLLIASPAGLRVAEDVWDLWSTGGTSSTTGWMPALARA